MIYQMCRCFSQNFVNKAVLVRATRYHVGSKVTHSEFWNEPDVWTGTDWAGEACVARRNGRVVIAERGGRRTLEAVSSAR